MNQIERTVKDYILAEFLPGEAPDELTESVPLVTGGILDSIAVVKLVIFLEEQYEIEFQAPEVSTENLNTLSDIATYVAAKLESRR